MKIKLKTNLDVVITTEEGQSIDVTLYVAGNHDYDGASLEAFMRGIRTRIEQVAAERLHREMHAPPPAPVP